MVSNEISLGDEWEHSLSATNGGRSATRVGRGKTKHTLLMRLRAMARV